MSIDPTATTNLSSFQGLNIALADAVRRISALETRSGSIAINAVDSAQVAPGAIQAGHILAGTIVAGHIQAGAIGADAIAANAINSGHILAGAVKADEIDALAISAGHIAANSINSGHIVAGAVKADEIDALAVTTDKLQAGAVTALKMNVATLSAITADMGTITAGTITGATFQTSASNPRVYMNSTGLAAVDAAGVTTFKADASTGKIITLAGVGGANRLYNASFEDGVNKYVPYSITGASTLVSNTGGLHGAKSALITCTTAGAVGFMGSNAGLENVPPVVPGVDYAASVSVAPNVTRTIRVYVYWYNSGFGFLGQATDAKSCPSGVWTRVEVSGSSPATAVYALVAVVMEGAAVGNTFIADSIQFEQGSIPTGFAPKPDEILPSTVTGTEIAPDAVAGDHIVENAISAAHINAGSIEAIHLEADMVIASTIRTATAGRRVELSLGGVKLLGASNQILVDLPTDASRPASFAGDLSAASATIENNLSLRGTNNVIDAAALLTVTGQQSPPATPLTPAVDLDALALPDPPFGNGRTGHGSYRYSKGVYYDPVGYNPGGGTQPTILYAVKNESSIIVALVEVRASDGVYLRHTELGSWGFSGQNQVVALGVARRGGVIYVAGSKDNSAAGDGSDVVVKRVVQADFSQHNSVTIPNASIPQIETWRGAFGTDGTYLCFVTTQNDTGLTSPRILRYSDDDTPGGAWTLHSTINLTGLPYFDGRNAPVTPRDFLGVCFVGGKWWISHDLGGVRGANSFDGTSLALETETGFVNQGGITHDGSRFLSLISEGTTHTLQRHTNWTWTATDQYLIWSYTWYATNPYETTASALQAALNVRPDPSAANRAYRRCRFNLSVPNFPSGVSRFRIYMAHHTATTIAASSLKLQAAGSYVTSEVASPAYQSNENAAGAAPPTLNTWPGGSPATVKSGVTGWLLDGGGRVILPQGNAFPSSPQDGQVFIYEVTEGTRWWFQYNSGSASANKWEFMGGPPLRAFVGTDGTYSSTTVYGDISGSAGPSVSIPLAGEYDILIGTGMWASADAAGYYSVSGAGMTANDARAINWGENAGYGSNNLTRHLREALTVGTLTAKYKKQAGSGTLHYWDRTIVVYPVRVAG